LGFDLIQKFKKIHSKIILVTSIKKVHIRLLSTRFIVDYLVKPEDRFQKAIQSKLLQNHAKDIGSKPTGGQCK
jgi:response regulator of citrate/malate metabolism